MSDTKDNSAKPKQVKKKQIPFAKTNRTLLHSAIATDLELIGLYTLLTWKASHQPSKINFRGCIYPLARGQVIITELGLAAITGISRKKIRGQLKQLEGVQLIRSERDNRKTIITLLDYDVSYDFRSWQGTTEDTTEGTTEGTTEEHNKEGKEGKENKPQLTLLPNLPDPDLKTPFPDASYPFLLTQAEKEKILDLWDSRAEIKFVCDEARSWTKENRAKFSKRVDHYQFLTNWRMKPLTSGRRFFDHPEHGPAYYMTWEIERCQN